MSRRAILLFVGVAACGGKIDPTPLDPGPLPIAPDRPPTRPPSGGSSSGGGASSSSGVVLPLACKRMPIAPFTHDFEEGTYRGDFTVKTPSAFSIEWDEPIRGDASLRVQPGAASYLARNVNDACAVRLEFTIRATAEFLKGGGNLARVDAGSYRFTIVHDFRGLVLEEDLPDDNVIVGAVVPIGQLTPDVPATISLDVDLAQGLSTFGYRSRAGDGTPAIRTMATPSRAPAIVSIGIGSVPSTSSSSPTGLYWIDDININ